jgi:hypothetical protein
LTTRKKINTKKTFLLAVILLSVGKNSCQNLQWSVSGDFPSSRQICNDDAGNIYTSGFWGDSYPNYGSQIKKFTPSGQLIWVLNLAQTDIRIHVTRSNTIWFTGADSSGYYLRTFDTAGVQLSSQLILPRKGQVYNASVFNVTSDSLDNVYLSGTYRDTLSLGNETLINNGGGMLMFIAKLSPTGNHLWLRGGSKGNLYTSLHCITTGDGTSYLGGSYIGPLVIGSFTLPIQSGGGIDMNAFLCKYDSEGTIQWLLDIGSNKGTEDVLSLTTDANHDLIVAGSYNQQMNLGGQTLTGDNSLHANIFLWKLSPNGQSIWCKQFGGTSREYASALTTNGTAIYMAGSFQATTNIGSILLTTATGGQYYDPFIARVNEDGSVDWCIEMGAANGSDGVGLAVCNNGTEIFLTGEYMGSFAFQNFPQTSQISTQYIVKIIDGSTTNLERNPISYLRQVRIYPNPSENNFTVSAKIKKDTLIKISIVDSEGRIILNDQLLWTSQGYSKSISIDTFPPGVYFIILRVGSEQTTKKIIKY